ncbi:MAG: exodeoxyribonuclease VII small subunit [Desulfobulbaceae bacterium]|nr:exodeoxyribonuclease VII small subunit [Desulfobulbaceae bacterium]
MAKPTFENALARLEQLTGELESGDLSLDASLKKFDEGIKLVAFCNKNLTDVRAKVEILLSKDGQLDSVPFNEIDHGDQDISE